MTIRFGALAVGTSAGILVAAIVHSAIPTFSQHVDAKPTESPRFEYMSAESSREVLIYRDRVTGKYYAKAGFGSLVEIAAPPAPAVEPPG